MISFRFIGLKFFPAVVATMKDTIVVGLEMFLEDITAGEGFRTVIAF